MDKNFSLVILRRILNSVVILFVVITIVFVILKISPGDPSLKYLSPNLNPELMEKVKSDFSLDEPLYKQYLSFITNFVSGDWGVSSNFQQQTFDVVLTFLPFTILFAVITFAVQLLASFFLAFLTSLNKLRRLNKFLNQFLLVIYATPPFVTGLILIFIFSVQFKMFPSSGLISLDYDSFGFWERVGDYAQHMVLPVVTLALSLIPIYYKYLRDTLDNLFDSTFVLNLRANGVSESTIVLKNIIPNALNPIIAAAGIDFGLLLGGTLITEVIFGLPGMGRLTMDAIFARDFSLIIGCCFSAAVLMILSNLLADLVRGLIDKRTIKEMIR